MHSTVREGMVVEKSRQVVAARSLCPERSTPDRTGQLQERRRGEVVLDSAVEHRVGPRLREIKNGIGLTTR